MQGWLPAWHQPCFFYGQPGGHRPIFCKEIINSQIAVPCTSCSCCTEGCSQKICIPQYFSLYNEEMRESVSRLFLPRKMPTLSSMHSWMNRRSIKFSMCWRSTLGAAVESYAL